MNVVGIRRHPASVYIALLWYRGGTSLAFATYYLLGMFDFLNDTPWRNVNRMMQAVAFITVYGLPSLINVPRQMDNIGERSDSAT